MSKSENTSTGKRTYSVEELRAIRDQMIKDGSLTLESLNNNLKDDAHKSGELILVIDIEETKSEEEKLIGATEETSED